MAESFFSVVELPGDSSGRPGSLVDMHEGRLGAVVYRGLFSDDALQRGLTAFLDADSLTPHPFSPRFTALSYGRVLDNSADALPDYHAEVAPLRAAVDAGFGAGFDARLREALSGLAPEGIDVDSPRNAAGQSYAPYTIRSLPTDGLIPPHCGRDQLTGPAYEVLGPQIRQTTLLSYFVTLQCPEAGGELVVYDLTPDDVPAFYADRNITHGRREGFPQLDVELGAGDLIVFDGGRNYHQVLPVIGPRTRWTIGGFIGPAVDGAEWFRWS